MKRNSKKIISICLALLLISSLIVAEGSTLVYAENKDTVIEIANVEDFLEFAKNCQYDNWGDGKTVKLTRDIDISSLDFGGIAYFSGTFDGGGYTISHVSLSYKGSNFGFFRYLGENALVTNLTISGKVNPEGSEENIGGMVGVNYGTLTNCTYKGTVEGQSTVGAIVGMNKSTGKIIRCSSEAIVTATNETGGIAGANDGLISGCTSKSNINIDELSTTMDLGGVDIGTLNLTQNLVNRNDMGGIAGSSTGIITECVNQGLIGYLHTGYNVGGIVGSQNGKVIDCTNLGEVYGRKDVGGIVGQAEPYIESEYLEDKVDAIQDSVKSINNTLSNISSTVSQTSTDAKNYAQSLSDQYKDSSGTLSDSLSDLSDSIGDTNPEAQQYMKNINDALDRIDAIQSNNKILTEDQANEIQNNWQTINSNLSSLRGTISNSSETSEDFVNNISDQLKAKDTNGDIESLTNTIDNGVQSVTNGVNKIVNQIQNIGSNVSESLSVVTGEEEYIEDISSIDSAENTDGVISGCINRGSINGDLNVGGIAGTMNIEYDVDPEFDIDLTTSTNITLRSTVNDVVIHCKNYGEITSKKNCAGGVTGLQELGLINGCEGYGHVQSDSGDYLGGIVGDSASAIAVSYSLCNVDGNNYTGGICGMGYTIKNCVTVATIYSDGEARGSIAGTVSEEGEVKGNLFANEELDGIDHINYAGVADKVSYDTIMELENIPEGFKKVTVTFKADDSIIDTKTVVYGGTIQESELPEIPEKDGYYAYWPEKLTEKVMDENETVEAEYTLWAESIASNEKAENEKAIFMVEGKFYKETALNLSETDTSKLNGNIVYAYSWKLEETRDKSYDMVTSHFYVIDESGSNEVWYQNADGSWKQAVISTDGSYLVADIPYGAAFALVHQNKDYTIYYLCGGAAVLVLILILGVKRRKQNKKGK